ncbi:MAG TPA: hypothetical protein VKO18_02935 [Terriglobia bacterium]|nr:hypothetical protein [Terriglobia bacterium]
MTTNDLYFVVLPLIHIGSGLTEQTLTLLPDKNFATEFYQDEVQNYIDMFENRAKKYLSGGHVSGYNLQTEPTEDGRFLVRVTQRVA